MRRMTACLAAIVAACVVPSAIAVPPSPVVLRCGDTTFEGRPNGNQSHTWVNVEHVSPRVFKGFAGSVTAPDGRVIEQWETPAVDHHAFITCFGTIGEFRTEMQGEFFP